MPLGIWRTSQGFINYSDCWSESYCRVMFLFPSLSHNLLACYIETVTLSLFQFLVSYVNCMSTCVLFLFVRILGWSVLRRPSGRDHFLGCIDLLWKKTFYIYTDVGKYSKFKKLKLNS